MKSINPLSQPITPGDRAAPPRPAPARRRRRWAPALLVLLLLANTVWAASPGLPFTEDFAGTGLRDANLTNANWSTGEEALLLASRSARYGAFGAGLTGIDITTDEHATHATALGDLDGDGDLDLVAGNTNGQVNRAYLNDGEGDPFDTLGGSNITGDGHRTLSVALGDVDGDGDLDLVAGNEDHPDRLYLNDGGGAFMEGINISDDTHSTASVALGDVDGDGHQDLVTGTYAHGNFLYLNDGGGGFDDGVKITEDDFYAAQVALGDVDGDGDLDLVSLAVKTPRLYLNDGSGTFDDGRDIGVVAAVTVEILLGDLDGDGDLDLVTGNQGAASFFYLNNGSPDPFSGADGTRVTTDARWTTSLALGDVDGDGDLDLVEGNAGAGDRTNWLYLNNGSADPFDGTIGTSITGDSVLTISVVLGDVDGDGDLDLVAGNGGRNRLYLNQGTASPFHGVTGSDITGDAGATWAVALGDVDGDGHLDLVAGNRNQINRLYLNDGTGTLGPGSNITGDVYITQAVALGDVDDDGHLDLVTGNMDQRNRLYLGDGAGGFGAGSDISIDADSTYSVALGDVDADGDLDLIAGNYGQKNRLYMNNGTDSPFSSAVGIKISDDEDSTFSVALGDVDDDGDLDLVAGNSGRNRLYLNDGTDSPFSPVLGSDITFDNHSTWQVALGDLDRDGDLDLAAGNYGDPNRIYLNSGGGAFGPGSNIGAASHNTESLALGDMDRDGDLDVVAGNVGQANHLYLNNGTAAPFGGVSGSDVSADSDDTLSLALGDVDLDSDLDVVAGNTGQTNRLYLNGSTASSFVGVVGSDVGADAHRTYSIALGDVDADGDTDLVAGNGNSEVNRLYLNNGTAGPFAGVGGSNISDDAHRTFSVALGDVDGDGDLDLVAGNHDQVNRLYLNQGGGTFDGGHNITGDAHSTLSVALGDMDGDGDLDLVAGNYGDPNRLYLNGGGGTFGPGSNISEDTHITSSVALGDVDGDGDLDVVAGDHGQGRVPQLYLNDGSGTFEAGRDIGGDTRATVEVLLGDLDGDGDLDLVAGNQGQPNRYYRNNGTADPFNEATGTDITTDEHWTTSIALGDVDGDGDLDLVEGVGGATDRRNRLYLNNGTADPFDGTIGASITDDSVATACVVLGDVNRDGDLDLVAGNYDQVNRLYRRVLYHTGQGRAGSLRVDAETENIERATLTPTASLPPNTGVTYWLSNNGGTRWLIVRPGVDFFFPTTGTDLRWRADLRSLSPVRTPRIDQIRINDRFTVYVPLVQRGTQ